MARCGKYVPIDMNESKCANEYQEGDQKKGETYALSASKCEISDHAMTETTDEFGVINFATNGANGRKFVRVDTSTDMLYDKLEWMINMLKMGKPNLLISVTGNTTNCEIKPRLKDVFQRSLIKAASTTGAWIITEGFHAGAANVVGDAVQYYRETSANRGPVVVIGIAPWGVIQNSLIRNDKKGSGPAEYLIADNEISNDKCLDPNHSHFILVDNGTHKAVTEITFRAKLEKTISKLNPSEGTVDSISLGSVLSYVPRVILVLKGGSRSLETVRHALSQSTPAVIIKGSGGAADILAYFFMKRANRAIEGIETEIRKHLERINFGSKSEHKDNIKRILDCLDRSALIHILEWNSDIDAHDMEMAMLKALLNGDDILFLDRGFRNCLPEWYSSLKPKLYNYGWMMETLGLALVLDKVDIAKSDIFTDMYTDDNKTQTVRLEKIMLLAIKMDRVNFVELFLDQGIRITDCLKYKILLLLYNQASTKRTIKILFNKICREKFEREWNGTIDATKAEQLKQYLRRDLLNEMDATAGDNDAGDAQDLFLWSVLTNRLKMAEMFWRRSKDPMATALIGSALFSAMSHRISDRGLMTNLKDNANVFTKMAIGVLNESHRKDEKQSQQLLALETSSWGNVPCVRIAAKVKNEEFISQPECLEYFKNTWKGELTQDNGPLKLFICTIIPVLIPLIATFKENSGAGLASGGDAAVYDVKEQVVELPGHKSKDSGPPTNEDKSNVDANNLNMMKKITSFYQAPVAKFCLNVISYIIFLCLYSYTLICKLEKEWSVEEIILIVWVFTFFTEEVRQRVYSRESLTWKKAYFKDVWNLIDITTILMFVIGMILRFIPHPKTIEAARIILGLDLVVFFMRLLHSFCLHKDIGPKLAMIILTFQSMLSFLLILMVVSVPYAIACHAIMYPNAELNLKTLIAIVRRPYWNIYGELLLNEIEEDSKDCTNDAELYKNGTFPRCSTESGKYFVPVMMGVYMLICNILLLNLLIVMFSNTVERVQKNIDMYFNLQLLSLIDEYGSRPYLPPPFILFEDVYKIIEFLVKRYRQSSPPANYSEPSKHHNIGIHSELRVWEQELARQYYGQPKTLQVDPLMIRMDHQRKELQLLSERIDSLQENKKSVKEYPSHKRSEMIPVNLENNEMYRMVNPDNFPQIGRIMDSLNQLQPLRKRSGNSIIWGRKQLRTRLGKVKPGRQKDQHVPHAEQK